MFLPSVLLIMKIIIILLKFLYNSYYVPGTALSGLLTHLLLEANVAEKQKMIKVKLNLKNRKIVYEN